MTAQLRESQHKLTFLLPGETEYIDTERDVEQLLQDYQQLESTHRRILAAKDQAELRLTNITSQIDGLQLVDEDSLFVVQTGPEKPWSSRLWQVFRSLFSSVFVEDSLQSAA